MTLINYNRQLYNKEEYGETDQEHTTHKRVKKKFSKETIFEMANEDDYITRKEKKSFSSKKKKPEKKIYQNSF